MRRLPPGALRPGEVGNTHPVLGASPANASTDPLTAELCRLHLTVSKKFIAKLDRARSEPGACVGRSLGGGSHRGRPGPPPGAAGQPPGRREEAAEEAPSDEVETKTWRSSAPSGTATRANASGRLESGGICGSTLRWRSTTSFQGREVGRRRSRIAVWRAKFHNGLAARQVFGDDWMNRYTSRPEGIFRQRTADNHRQSGHLRKTPPRGPLRRRRSSPSRPRTGRSRRPRRCRPSRWPANRSRRSIRCTARRGSRRSGRAGRRPRG